MRKRSVVISGHKTSIAMEDDFWNALKEIAFEKGQSVSSIIAAIDLIPSSSSNLSSKIRIYVLHYYKNLAPLHDEKA